MESVNVMIVEDDEGYAELTEDILISLGYAISAIVPSGEEALEKVTEASPDIILMDIMLRGGLDGIETARRIQEKQRIPIIFTTSHSEGEVLERAKLVNPSGYLVKPITRMNLHPAIRVALHRHKVEERLRRKENKYRFMLEKKPTLVSFKFVPREDIVSSDKKCMKASDRFSREFFSSRSEGDEGPSGTIEGHVNGENSNVDLKKNINLVAPVENLKPIYRTKTAAKMSGVGANLIRTYERMGLVSPYRDTDNNYRLFTLDEIDWLARISRLIHREGLNIEGIRRILTLRPCWETNKCPEEIRSKCILAKDPNKPCWSSLEHQDNGILRPCFSCSHYLAARRHPKLTA